MKFERIQPPATPIVGAARTTRRGAVVAPIAAIALAAAVAMAIQTLWLPIDADVSWLITVSERVLSGDRLYVDILEVNPPASVWLYLPLVWWAQLLGARPEAVVAAAFVAAGAASTLASLRLAGRLDDAPSPLWLAAGVSFVGLVLPMALFAQREHAALLLAIPALAALAVIASDRPISRAECTASGFAAGLVIVFKPYFLVAILAPAAWAAWKRRTLWPLMPGIAAAAATIALYGVALFLLARPYFEILPAIAHTYAPIRSSLWKLIIGPSLYPAICLGLALLLRAPRIPSLTVTWALGAAGFLLAAFAQAKNYPNHWLPQAGLALLAAMTLLSQPGLEKLRKLAVAAGLAVVALSEMYYWAIVPDPAVASGIRRLAPPDPKIISLSPQLTTGHPATRNVDGRWVGSRAGLFTASGAMVVGLGDPLARQLYRADIRSFVDDVTRHSPDVVLVHRASKSWLMSEEAIRKTMARYRPAAVTKDTEIWVRRRGEAN